MTGLPFLVSFPDQPASVEQIAQELLWSKKEKKLALDLQRRSLPPLATPSCLSYIFGVSPKLISAMGRSTDRYYRVFRIPKTRVGYRQIESPRRFLKVIQRWIHDHILSNSDFPPYVIGFVRGRNIFDNGLPHAKAKNLMVVDIEDFFPSVKLDEIVEVFARTGFPFDVATQLARLCSYDGRLPQGAPTSPGIANLTFLSADKKLTKLAKKWKCTYTRYADDLAFSGLKRFSTDDIQEVKAVLTAHGFTANKDKCRIIGGGGCHILAGLVVNDKPQPPRWKRRLWRQLFYRASSRPREFGDRLFVLRGIAAFVNQYDRGRSSDYQAVIRKVAEANQTT